MRFHLNFNILLYEMAVEEKRSHLLPRHLGLYPAAPAQYCFLSVTLLLGSRASFIHKDWSLHDHASPTQTTLSCVQGCKPTFLPTLPRLARSIDSSLVISIEQKGQEL
jgi:hypothetical protein